MPEEPKQLSESINQDKISQGEMIELLQKTIGQLVVIVNKLSTESIENLPPREVVKSLTSNTEVLAELLQNPQIPIQPVELTDETYATDTLPPEIVFDEADLDSDEPTEPVEVEPVNQSPTTLPDRREGRFSKIRSLLPTTLTDKLSNRAIIGILSTVVVATLVVSIVLVTRPSLKIAQTPTPTITPTPTSTPEVLLNPPEIEAPGNPEPIDFAPPPEPELTPEQSLIASIQEEVNDLTRQYPERLIGTIEANFLASRLSVTLGNEWYNLNPSRQNNLANAIFKRSRRLDFQKLELMNQEGNLIARSPVVGEEMVILERKKDLATTL